MFVVAFELLKGVFKMKLSFVLFVFLLFSSVTFANLRDTSDVSIETYLSETDNRTLIHEGIPREVLVYSPPKVKAYDGKVPVVFMFHGTGGDGMKFWKISQWKEKARKEGFIAVFPTALRTCYYSHLNQRYQTKTKWNNGLIELCEGEVMSDDVALFRRMVDLVTSVYNGDPKRIYVSGFSNGGTFTSRLSLDAGDLIAAASGAGHGQKLFYTPVEKIPFYHILGANDPKALKDLAGELVVDSSIVRNSLYMEGQVYPFLDVFELNINKYLLKETTYGVKMLFNKSLTGDSNYFISYLIDGLDHQYPNGNNHPVVAANILYKFFMRHSK